MTWAGVAHPHIGHRTVLKDVYLLKCVDCGVTLLIHREGASPTSTPPRWQMPEDGTPMPGWFRERVNAELLARRKTSTEETG